MIFMTVWSRSLLRKHNLFYNGHKVIHTSIVLSNKCSGAASLKRAERSGPCRLGFIPEEWFQFLRPKTGVSGPYIFGIVLTNYLVSKEIYVMEHEYYLGLSIAVVMYQVCTKLGPSIGASLDKEVDEVANEYEKDRKMEIADYEKNIAEAKLCKLRAQAQKTLIDAKKENVALQLEAEYRERCVEAFRAVKGRMDYHVKRYYTENRIHQRWMTDWILKNVMKSITPEFEQAAMDQAIKDLEAAASKA